MKIKVRLIKSLVLLMAVVATSGANAAPEQKFVDASNPSKPTFRDIPKDHWAKEAASQLLASGVLEGNKRDEFRGNDFMTRYEFALAMARVFYSTVCILPPPPDEHVYAKKDDLSEVLKRLTAIETRLKTLEEKADLKKDTAAEQLTQKELGGLKSEFSDVNKQLAQVVKTQTP